MSELKTKKFYVSGMHCASCEILVEKKLLENPNIKFADANISDNSVEIKFINQIDLDELNKLFQKDEYQFSESPTKITTKTNWRQIIFYSAILIAVFYIFNKTGIASVFNVDKNSSIWMFFVFGLLTGISSCAALVGGLILSLGKYWHDKNSQKNLWQKLSPYLGFNIGRLVSYFILGAILGFIGAKLQFSLNFTSILVALVSLVMLVLGLRMLEIKLFSKNIFGWFNFSKKIFSADSLFIKYSPIVIGALTFFLPCGFTIAAQGLALISGNGITGGLIMFSFALGTLIPLLVISFTSVKFYEHQKYSRIFTKVAGILVIFFAFFNINNSWRLISFPKPVINNNQINTNQENDSGLPQIIDGKQILKMEVYYNKYVPNKLKVRAGIPVKWEINVASMSGCTSSIIAPNIFSDQIYLSSGQIIIKEFTIAKPGKYRFSCSMGMVNGVIEAK